MWKTTSMSVTAKLRVLPNVSLTQKTIASSCQVLTQVDKGQLQSPQTPPSLKEVPKPGTFPDPDKPPQPKKKGGTFKYLSLGVLAGTAGVVGYTLWDEESRAKLFADYPRVKELYNGNLNIFNRGQKPADVQEPPMIKVKRPVPAAPPPVVETPKEVVKEVKVETAAEKKEREKKQKEAEIARENADMEESLQKILNLCTSMVKEAGEVADNIIKTTKAHTEALKTAMDDNNILEKETQWQTVSMAFDAREEAVRNAEGVMESATEDLEKLRKLIESGRTSAVTKKNKMLTTSKDKLNQLSMELSKKQAEVAKVESEARVMSKYKDLINKGKEQFKKELESIMPDVKIGKGKKLSEEELNVLIAHAHKRIDQLTRQLAAQVAMEQQRIQEAMSDQREEDERLANYRIEQKAKALQNEFSTKKEKWEEDAQTQFEIELQRQLTRQTAAHSDHLQEVLAVQEKRLYDQFEREMHIKLIAEREKFDTEISGWVARLRGIEAAVEARAESEKVAQQAQELWLACLALNGAIRVGNEDGKTWEEQLKPLEPEVMEVFQAARKNPFVNLILESIPEKALTRGVYTEDNLKERFRKVRKVAKRVALIDETGGSLVKYFLSYVQSFFVFNSVYASSNLEEVDLNSLDTFQILNYANFYLQRGDLEQGLKFMNLLRGESRRVASDWIEEARLHLEAKQAAFTLMAFASATGLGTIF